MLQFAFIYLLHILPGHGLEVDGMMGNWKMSEGVKQSRGKVGKWVELTVFRLRIGLYFLPISPFNICCKAGLVVQNSLSFSPCAQPAFCL